jgi:hypothetical protein
MKFRVELAKNNRDDFEVEGESLRYNDEFITFLDARAKEPKIFLAEATKRFLERD